MTPGRCDYEEVGAFPAGRELEDRLDEREHAHSANPPLRTLLPGNEHLELLRGGMICCDGFEPLDITPIRELSLCVASEDFVIVASGNPESLLSVGALGFDHGDECGLVQLDW